MKRPSQSATTKTEVVCSNDTNPMGFLKGGKLLDWMDMAAAICAQTHSGVICVTASISYADFRKVARIGDIITINAAITRTFTTSMEIRVLAIAKNIKEKKSFIISEAFFIFVALDDNGQPSRVIKINPVTSAEKEQYIAAQFRRKRSTTKRRSEPVQ